MIDTLGTSAGGKMKETGSIHWSCPNVGAINTSGFSALPSGICEPRDGGDGRFAGLNFSAHFWSTDSHSPDLSSYDDKVQMFNWDGYNGFSVRCLKGDSPLATVTTTDITGITETSASGGGNVTSDGGYVVTAKGVCWNSNETPTTSDSKTINGIGTGVFTSSISGLTAGRPYNVRAYATNSVGTAYGVAKQFTTTGGGGAFTDPRDGHNYPYKTIGIQTWMTENLAYLLAVSPSSAGSETNPYYYVLGYEGSTVASAKATANYSTYGVLYNWEAAKTACPSGWHLPTDDEWKILEKNQGMSETDANTGGWRDSGAVGGKLKETGTTHWWNPNTGATNSSGFTALPGGYRYNSGAFSLLGLYAYFWSSSECGSTALYRYLDYYFDGVYQDCRYRSYGFSVRCLRN
ncbi:MAG: hypothetical protein NTV01_21735 [Bacteroidia bacterium]|nr:hypothetical protein [Bacteroidia bacterium]